MNQFRIHWFTATVFNLLFRDHVWAEFFEERLGPLHDVGHGMRGFQRCQKSVTGAMYLSDPVQNSEKGDYFTIDLNGESCDCLTPGDIREFLFFCVGHEELERAKGWPGSFSIKRIDLAFDGVDFEPIDFYQHCKEDLIVSRASRSSIRFISSPYENRENGEQGCDTAYLGAPSSERRVRVYNQHGFTRVEFQVRGEWADKIARLLIKEPWRKWKHVALGALANFVMVESPWWDEFMLDREQVEIVVKSARIVSINKLEKWHDKQLAPGVYTLMQVMGEENFLSFIKSAAEREGRLERWQPVLEILKESGD